MPAELQYVDFAIGIIGLIFTIGTLITSLNVKKHLLKRVETDAFRNRKTDIINRIDGFINSINEDRIFENDNNHTFLSSVSQFLVDIETSFSFLSRLSRRKIKALQRKLQAPLHSDESWSLIAKDLIALKNYLNKELV